MIFWKKKKPVVKAGSGMNTEQIDQMNNAIAAGANAIPVWGQAISAGLNITKSASDAIIGDGSNEKKNLLGTALNPLSTVNALASGNFKEAIPIYGQVLAAKRIKREFEEKRAKEEQLKIQEGQQQSAQAYAGFRPKFSLYKKGGSLKKAVILGGKSHKDGGNDIIDAASGQKVAETEIAELLLNKQQTEQVEALIKSMMPVRMITLCSSLAS